VAASVGKSRAAARRRSEQTRFIVCERRRRRRIPSAMREQSPNKGARSAASGASHRTEREQRAYKMSVGPSKYELQGPTS
jgi:hypothetical protein